MSKKLAMDWFRQDLRLADNPTLTHASQADETITIFILDENQAIGSASKLWFHHSLANLNKSLADKLNFYKGDPLDNYKKTCQGK